MKKVVKKPRKIRPFHCSGCKRADIRHVILTGKKGGGYKRQTRQFRCLICRTEAFSSSKELNSLVVNVTVNLNTREEYLGGAEENGGDWSYRGTTTNELFGITASIETRPHYGEYEIPGPLKTGDEIFCVIRVYSDGDTFHHVERDYRCHAAFRTLVEAQEYLERNRHTDGYFDSTIEWRIEDVRIR